jgi:hypothetical protein
MKKLVCLLFLIVLTYWGCEKNPLGYEELQRNIANPQVIELQPTSSGRWSYRKAIPLGTSSCLILGKNSTDESRILMKFNFPDTTISLDSVISARLILYTQRLKAVSFSIYPTKQTSIWKEYYATWSRMDDNTPWDSLGGDFYPTLLAQGTVAEESTIVNLDLNKLDSLINHSSGIIIIPDGSQTDFAAFYAKEFLNKFPKIVLQFSGSSKTYSAVEDCHILNTTSIPELFDYWIGNGYSYRTLLKFNLNTLPSNVAITYAELILPIYEAFSIFDTVEIVAQRVLDSLPFSELTTFDNKILSRTSFAISADSLLILDLRSLVQFWNKYNGQGAMPDSNYGVIIATHPENYGLSRLKIKTSSPGIRLKVGYVLPPEGRF